jgi:hypothetical protein
MIRFSAIWSDALGKAIEEKAKDDAPIYKMSLVGEDARCVIAAVNQGIDAHLEACFIAERGDNYYQNGHKLMAQVSPESLRVLCRRLMESDDDTGLSLVSGICQTLDIELV